MKTQKKFRRNPSPEKKGQKALAVIQYLSWGSFLPLLTVYFKQGPFSIYYLRASRGGMWLSSLLGFFRIRVSEPLKIEDLNLVDSSHTTYWKTQFQSVKACSTQLDPIETLIQANLPKSTPEIRKLIATNVIKMWQLWVSETLLLRNLCEQLRQEEGLPNDCVILISKYASLLRILDLGSTTNNGVHVWSQPNQNEALLYLLGTIGFSVLEVFRIFFRSFLFVTTTASRCVTSPKIGVTAAWGVEGMDKSQRDDLFWWRNSSVAADRLIYMFEREDTQPTEDNVKQVQDLGIQSVALNSKHLKHNPNLLIKNNSGGSLLMSLQSLALVLKLGWKALVADDFSRTVLALVSWQYYSGEKLAETYKALNLKGIFHVDESGMDIISLASAMSDCIRIGTHWSSQTGINQTSSRLNQVYFIWGNHDAKIVLKAGGIFQSLLVAGCFVSDLSHKEAKQQAEMTIKKMRDRGVRYTLTLLAGSQSYPSYYSFFLQWLVDDPCLGILIKGKKDWNKPAYEGLDGLIERAFKTDRLHVVDPRASPADAAVLTDFAVGVSSTSALIIGAIEGARVLYLDYEEIDQGPQKPYCILHSLGSNRCIFRDPKVLRKALLDYFENPAGNPNLGDISPVLDQLEPFRDGKASQRIGEFVASYLEEIDNGSKSEDAVRYATDKYTQKWGADKVIQRS